MILPSSILTSNSVPLTWNGCPSNGGDFETGIFTCFLITTLYFSFSSSLPKYFARAFFLSSCSCFYKLHKCSACSSMSQDSCSMYRWLVRRRAMSACFLADHSSALSQYVDILSFHILFRLSIISRCDWVVNTRWNLCFIAGSPFVFCKHNIIGGRKIECADIKNCVPAVSGEHAQWYILG